MNRVELTIAKLRSLPLLALDEALLHIEQLHAASKAKRLTSLDATAGCLDQAEGEAFQKAIEDGCETLDV